jgi:hypothetical protein
MCWAPLADKDRKACCITPSWLRKNFAATTLETLQTEKEARYSNDPLNSDDFTEKCFNEVLMWFLATTTSKTDLVYPPVDARTCAQTVLSTLTQLGEISDTFNKPELETISAGIRNETFATFMLAKPHKMEKELPEAHRMQPRTVEEIGGSALMRRDFYHFSKAFLEDDTVRRKQIPISDRKLRKNTLQL